MSTHTTQELLFESCDYSRHKHINRSPDPDCHHEIALLHRPSRKLRNTGTEPRSRPAQHAGKAHMEGGTSPGAHLQWLSHPLHQLLSPMLPLPSPMACPDTATTALGEGGPRLCDEHSPATRVQGKGQPPTAPTPLSGTPLLRTKELWFKASQTNKATPGLTDPHFTWILLLLVPPASKGLQAAAPSSAVLEQSCSLACPGGDSLQTSPLLGQKGYSPSSWAQGVTTEVARTLSTPKQFLQAKRACS